MTDEDKKETRLEDLSPLQIALGIFGLFMILYSLYLTFKCNGGFKLGGFLAALFFPYIYVPYKLATGCNPPPKHSVIHNHYAGSGPISQPISQPMYPPKMSNTMYPQQMSQF